MKQRYTVVLIPEDEGFCATVPALPGCFAQGGSIPQALARIRTALRRWVVDGLSRGEPAPADWTRLDIAVTQLRVRGRRFTVVLVPDHKGYEATVPALPDCLVFADTADQALARLRGQIRTCMKEAERKGESLPNEGTQLQVIVAMVDV